MANKILIAYLIADALFLLMGVVILAFSIIVNNIKDEVPTKGTQAARNLLYQDFPLTGEWLLPYCCLEIWRSMLTIA